MDPACADCSTCRRCEDALKRLTEKVRLLESRLNNDVEPAVNRHDDRHDSTEADVRELRADVKALREEISATTSAIGQLRIDVGRLANAHSTHGLLLERINRGVDTLLARDAEEVSRVG